MAMTLEMGPRLDTYASEFMLTNHENRMVMLDSMMGERGLVLGFTGSVWEAASVRRILWLQRHHHQFTNLGVNLALLASERPQKLLGYAVSSLIPLEFPLLADPDRAVHAQYHMEGYAGMVLIDRSWMIRDKWIMPDERVWPRMTDLMAVIETL